MSSVTRKDGILLYTLSLVHYAIQCKVLPSAPQLRSLSVFAFADNILCTHIHTQSNNNHVYLICVYNTNTMSGKNASFCYFLLADCSPLS